MPTVDLTVLSGPDLVARLGEAAFDLDLIDDLFTAGFVDHSGGGRAEFRARLDALLQGLPDLTYTVEKVLDDGVFVAAHVALSGTHTAPLMGIPATGRTVRLTSVDLIRRDADGRVAERWGGIDTFSLLQQLQGP